MITGELRNRVEILWEMFWTASRKIVGSLTPQFFRKQIDFVNMIIGYISKNGMRYRYSKDIVYNNFPWSEPTETQKAKIEATAQGILDARALYPESSLADLYDELTMPPELRKAHKANDRAVMEAYGMWGKVHSEAECVAWLFRMYQKLTDEKQG